MNRRDAMTTMAGAAVLATEIAPSIFGAEASGTAKPWYATMRRAGQTNFNERDPIELNIDWWISSGPR